MNWFNRFKNPTLASVLDEWLIIHKIDIADSTAYGYQLSVKQYKEYFGCDTKIKSIQFDVLQNYIIYLKDVRKLANKTIHNKMKGLSLCLKYAVLKGYIKESPLNDVEVPTGRNITEKIPYTEEEMAKLLSLNYLAWVRDAVIIAYHTGMRLGEIFGLKWTDINFEQSFIMVQRSLSRGGCKAVIKTTKTKCSIRRIDIDRYLLEYLLSLRKASESVYVFSMRGNPGKYRIPWNMAARVKDMCVQAGVVPRDFHTLRHTHATILLAHGVHPKIVQERLGHSDIHITVDTYSYVTPTIQREAIRIFDDKKVPVVSILNIPETFAIPEAA